MDIITYSQRVGKIQQPGDEAKQLSRAKGYMLRLKRESRRDIADPEERARQAKRYEAAQVVVRQLRSNIFDLEELAQKRQAGATTAMVGAGGE